LTENISINVNLVLERIKTLLGITKDLELCESLGVKQTTFSSWRSRDTLDYKLIIQYAQINGMDLHHIFFGTTIEKPNATTEFLTMLTNLVAEKLQLDLKKQNELQEKLLYLLEKEDIRRQLEEARGKAQKQKKINS